MKSKLVLSTLALFAVILSACGTAATPAPTSLPTSNPGVPVTGGGTTVMVGQNATLGSFLVDSKGMTLYIYLSDTPGQSNCTGGCATNWPPLPTTGAPVAGQGVTASLLGTTTRADGTLQVTYNGWPLYYYASDKAAGDTNGEGIGNVWYVITPDGAQK